MFAVYCVVISSIYCLHDSSTSPCHYFVIYIHNFICITGALDNNWCWFPFINMCYMIYMSPPVIWNTICFKTQYVSLLISSSIQIDTYIIYYISFSKRFLKQENEKQHLTQHSRGISKQLWRIPSSTGSIFSGGIHRWRTTWRCYQLCLSLLGNELRFFWSHLPIGFGGNP